MREGDAHISRTNGARAAAWLLALSCVAVTALFLHGVVQRFPYPHELSKMEGGFVDHARFAAAGRPLYAPPSAEFVPFLYMPLAHHAAGALIRLGLDGYAATRLVSLLGIAGAIAVGMALVVRATGRRWLALLVPALACARYFDVECFYDQARPDNLMAGFCMAAAGALAIPSARVAVPLFVASGLLAFFTKQSAAFYLALLVAGVGWVRWRAALLGGALLAMLAAALFFALDARTDGWLKRYTVDVAAFHTIDRGGLLRLTTSGFLNDFALTTIAAAIAAFAVLRRGPRRDPPEPRALARHVAVAAVIAAGAFAFASSTQRLAVRNVFVLLALAAATFLPIAFDVLLRRLALASERVRRIGMTAVLLVLAIDVARGLRDPRPWTPTPDDERTWTRLHEACASFGPPERTWVMLHGASWGGRAGDPFHLHFGALSDLIGGYYGRPTGIEIPLDLRERIATRWYTSIVVAGWDRRARETLELESHYRLAPGIEPIRLPMFSGYGSQPSEIWIPREY